MADLFSGVSRRTSLRLGVATAAGALLPRAAVGEAILGTVFVADLRNQSFNDSWRFFRGDAPGLEATTFDEGGWRSLDLPHDWSIEDRHPESPDINATIRDVDTAPLWKTVVTPPRAIGPFNAELSVTGDLRESEGGAATGFTTGGIGWYRKTFTLPALDPDSHVELLFDGAYMNADVWLNGHHLGNHPYGYTPFGFDITPYLERSGKNVVAVRLANLGRNSRWYSGSGIYRPVWLNVTRSTRFAQWGVAVTTPDVSAATATVDIGTTVEGAVAGAALRVRIIDPAGHVVAQDDTMAASMQTTRLTVKHPRRWSPDTPDLYAVICELRIGDRVVDRMQVPLGIRRIEIDATAGLRINGKPYKLRGGCVHHDNGLLGAASFDRAEERKVELLKARGFNAVRTAHNPPSSAFLDACDRLGMLVMEEAFDCWREGKTVDDYSVYFEGWWRDDLAAMVRRDRNHPSVFMWSIGNEIPDKLKPQGLETAQMLATEMRRLDPSRPITAGINNAWGPDVTRADGRPDQATTQFLDVAGANYKHTEYEADHARFPARVLVGTESVATNVDAIWRLIERSPYVIGDFVWTAMDYVGESGLAKSYLSNAKPEFTGPYSWFNGNSGDVDLIGQQKPQSLLRDVVWGQSPVEISVQRPLPDSVTEKISLWGWHDELASWTWPGSENHPIAVSVYTRGDRVELSLNGRKISERTLTPADGSIARFMVPFVAGKLEARAFSGHRCIGTRTLETVGAPAALRIDLDRPRIRAGRGALAYATIAVVDAAGRVVPDAVHAVTVEMVGPAVLTAFGNANPRAVSSFQQPVAKTWHGRALAIIRSTGTPGRVAIRARTGGLEIARSSLMTG